MDVAEVPVYATEYAGLHYTVLQSNANLGISPKHGDMVKVQVAAWSPDGSYILDPSQSSETMELQLRTGEGGWGEAISKMREGQLFRVWVPASMLKNATEMKVVEIELLQVLSMAAPVDVAAPPSSATMTASGLAYQVLQAGTGIEHPDPYDNVVAHYKGWTVDGQLFDASYTREKPATFALSKVIPGWQEGIALMVVGETTRFWIPTDLAYKGVAGAPAGMLVFDVELLEILNQNPPPPVPKDVAKPPKKAKRTKSGLRYQILSRGKPGPKPQSDSRVTVQYTGWTTDGKMFDTSVNAERAPQFPLEAVIPGFSEGLQKMRVGDTYLLWIPENLAYKGTPGKPTGMLVFEIELLDFE